MRPLESSGRAVVAAVFDGLNRSGLSWVLLRGRAALGAPGGDVDLLVRPDHLESFEDVVFELGGFVLPGFRLDRRRRPPWHRFYVVSDPATGASVKLDVVTRLVYGRRLQLSSDLELGCLQRRVRNDDVYVLDPSDFFWTLLLHCLLDKQKVTEKRGAELTSLVDQVRRPTPGEEFFESLSPPGTVADNALLWVRDRDWDSLALLGGRIHEGAGAGAPSPDPVRAAGTGQRRSSKPGGETRRTPSLGRRTAEAVYPAVWRRAGLGVVPRVFDVVEEGRVEGTVLDLRRRPGRCVLLLLTPDAQHGRLCAKLREDKYLFAAGRWNRLTSVGLESVRLVTPSQLSRSAVDVDRLRESSLSIAGRQHCRRAADTGPWHAAEGPPRLSSPTSRPVGGPGA